VRRKLGKMAALDEVKRLVALYGFWGWMLADWAREEGVEVGALSERIEREWYAGPALEDD